MWDGIEDPWAVGKPIAHGQEMGLTGSLLAAPAFVGRRAEQEHAHLHVQVHRHRQLWLWLRDEHKRRPCAGLGRRLTWFVYTLTLDGIGAEQWVV
jgi:hypothetical protein